MFLGGPVGGQHLHSCCQGTKPRAHREVPTAWQCNNLWVWWAREPEGKAQPCSVLTSLLQWGNGATAAAEFTLQGAHRVYIAECPSDRVILQLFGSCCCTATGHILTRYPSAALGEATRTSGWLLCVYSRGRGEIPAWSPRHTHANQPCVQLGIGSEHPGVPKLL